MDSIVSMFLGPTGQQEPYLFISLMAIVFAGAFITSGFGIGSALVMTPLFMFFLPPKFGIASLAPLMAMIGGTGVRQYWKQWDKHSLLVLLPASILGIWVGTYLLAVISPEAVRKIVGGLAVFFGTYQFISIDRPEWKNLLRPSTWQGVGFGFASGISTAVAHAGGIVFSFYLLPHSPTKEIFVATTVFIFFVTGVVKLGTYWYYELLTFPIFLFSLSLFPPLLLGSILGKRLNQRISPKLFMRLITIFIGVMGLRLVLG